MSKTEVQVAKERAFLSRVTLCIHNQWGRCNPPNGKKCNFAHWLNELQPPEEGSETWWKIWQKGEVDICFWKEYKPNPKSVERFTCQFRWENKHHIDRIPNWAWGHAVDLGLIRKEDVPADIPKDFEWPEMQEIWGQAQTRGSDQQRGCHFHAAEGARP